MAPIQRQRGSLAQAAALTLPQRRPFAVVVTLVVTRVALGLARTAMPPRPHERYPRPARDDHPCYQPAFIAGVGHTCGSQDKTHEPQLHSPGAGTAITAERTKSRFQVLWRNNAIAAVQPKGASLLILLNDWEGGSTSTGSTGLFSIQTAVHSAQDYFRQRRPLLRVAAEQWQAGVAFDCARVRGAGRHNLALGTTRGPSHPVRASHLPERSDIKTL